MFNLHKLLIATKYRLTEDCHSDTFNTKHLKLFFSLWQIFFYNEPGWLLILKNKFTRDIYKNTKIMYRIHGARFLFREIILGGGLVSVTSGILPLCAIVATFYGTFSAGYESHSRQVRHHCPGSCRHSRHGPVFLKVDPCPKRTPIRCLNSFT